MIHNPRSYKGGESKDLRHEADVLDKIKDIMIEAYKSKTGMNNKIIASMMDNETWLKPDEAHKMGFVDEIKNRVFSRKLNHVAVTPNQVYACFVNNKSIYMNSELLKLLGLSDGATEKEIVQAVKDLKKRTKKDEDQPNETEIENILNQAINEKKFTHDLKEHFATMLHKDFDTTNNLIAQMRGVPQLSKLINPKGQAEKDIKNDRSKWGLEEYRMYAPNELRQNQNYTKNWWQKHIHKKTNI